MKASVRPYNTPLARAMPTRPTAIQKMLSREYAGSLRSKEHHDSKMASRVLNTQTNKKGLAGPSQLTKVKLKIRINTPVISTARMFFRINLWTGFILGGNVVSRVHFPRPKDEKRRDVSVPAGAIIFAKRRQRGKRRKKETKAPCLLKRMFSPIKAPPCPGKTVFFRRDKETFLSKQIQIGICGAAIAGMLLLRCGSALASRAGCSNPTVS